MREERRGGGSELGSDLDLKLDLENFMNADPLGLDPQHCRVGFFHTYKETIE